MIDAEASRMKRLPLEALKRCNQLGACALGQPGPPAIDRISDQGVTDMSHVDADLMRAAGLELDFNQCVGGKSLVDSIVGDSGLSIGANCKALAVTPVPADGKVNGSPAGQRSLHQGQILAMDGMRLKLFDEELVSFNGARHHQKTAGVLVNPMHDTGPWHLVERGGVMQKRILECPVVVPSRRMNDQSLRFVDHNQGVILIDDMQGYGLRGHLRDRFKYRGQDDFFAAKEFAFGFCSLPINHHGTRPDPVLNSVSGILRKELT